MKVKSFRDLRVWQKSIDLVEDVYRVTELFPKQEVFGLCSQLRRAAVSIPSNIAEGHAREHLKEYLHFLSVSLGSLAELVTQLEIATRLSYLSKEKLNQILEQTDLLGKQINALRNSLLNSQR